MRQMVLRVSQGDLAVDPDVLGKKLEARVQVRADTKQCVDRSRVYEELERNQRDSENRVP
jgi:hypothetical protein